MTEVRRIAADFARPTPAQRAAVAAIATATLQDAMGGRGVLPSAIKPIRAGMRLCGPALTCACPPLDNMGVHAALKIARAGDVIVCAAGGGTEQGMFGDLMAVCAKHSGVEGLVMDGGVRDGDAMEAIGLPVFARSICVRAAGKDRLGPLAEPVTIGDVTIYPGDLVVGDADGVVVVPLAEIDAIVAAAHAKLAREASMRDALAAGQRTWDLQKLDEVLRKQGVEIEWR